MRSLILSQCRDLRMGVIWEDLGALTTVRATQFWICRRRFIWDLGRFDLGRESVTVVKFRVDSSGSDSTGCFGIEVRMDTAELWDMRIARLRKWWALIRESKVFSWDSFTTGSNHSNFLSTKHIVTHTQTHKQTRTTKHNLIYKLSGL